MRWFRYIGLCVILLTLQNCYKEQVVLESLPNHDLSLDYLLKFNENACSYDAQTKSLRCSIHADDMGNFSPLVSFKEYSEVYFENKRLTNNTYNNLGAIELHKQYRIEIRTNGETAHLTLSFTNLPIVQIVTPNTVYNEPKTLARLWLNYPEQNKVPLSYYIGMEYRGQTSQQYAKKSYGISLKGSQDLNHNVSGSFFDIKSNNDWILDAMWIDKSRLRNSTSFAIWSTLNSHNHFITGYHVELYINNAHQGLYCFSNNMNAEHLNLLSDESVLYKAVDWGNGATTFETYPLPISNTNVWQGWEQKHPDDKNRLNWTPLSQLSNLVVNGSDSAFNDQIGALIDVESFIDYFIFLNVVAAADNIGKNTFLVKTNEAAPFQIIPWDVDGSFGLFWDGSTTPTTSLFSNQLYERLMQNNTHNFKGKVKDRWSYLRNNSLSTTTLLQQFNDRFTHLSTSDIIQVENQQWAAQIDLNSEQAYLTQWLTQRMLFLDVYFQTL